jgi:hypothetical protein
MFVSTIDKSCYHFLYFDDHDKSIVAKLMTTLFLHLKYFSCYEIFLKCCVQIQPLYQHCPHKAQFYKILFTASSKCNSNPFQTRKETC